MPNPPFSAPFQSLHGARALRSCPSRLLDGPTVSSRFAQLRRQLSANAQRDCQFISQREGHVLEHPALAPSHLDLAPRNEQRRVHESKEEHAGQIQTLRTDSNCQHVVVVRQTLHLSALHSPFRPIERHPRAIDLRQRAPTANEADYCADQKPQREKVDREDRSKNGGMLVNPVLEIHACQLIVGRLFGPKQPSSSRP
jgi:hypothetical protein